MNARGNAGEWRSVSGNWNLAARFQQLPPVPAGIDEQVRLNLVREASAIQLVEVRRVVDNVLHQLEPPRKILRIRGQTVQFGPDVLLRHPIHDLAYADQISGGAVVLQPHGLPVLGGDLAHRVQRARDLLDRLLVRRLFMPVVPKTRSPSPPTSRPSFRCALVVAIASCNFAESSQS